MPYYLGCPSWHDPAWRAVFYGETSPRIDYLSRYVSVFNAVEGNTTFYACPSPQTLERWSQLMPPHFRFCAKFPRDISHAADLMQTIDAAKRFIALLIPIHRHVIPFWLQLPSSFGPDRLDELMKWVDQLSLAHLAIEVRHPDFFLKGEDERRLNRFLLERGIERISLDCRALFGYAHQEVSVQKARMKKPLLPVRPTAFSSSPQVRFVGGPDIDENDRFLLPWVNKLAEWIEEGKTPCIFLHTPDNRLAPAQAIRFHQRLSERLPGLPELDIMIHQPSLFSSL